MICSAYAISFVVSVLPFNYEWQDSLHKHKVYVESKNSINNYYTVTDGKYRMTYWLECKEEDDENSSGL